MYRQSIGQYIAIARVVISQQFSLQHTQHLYMSFELLQEHYAATEIIHVQTPEKVGYKLIFSRSTSSKFCGALRQIADLTLELSKKKLYESASLLILYEATSWSKNNVTNNNYSTHVRLYEAKIKEKFETLTNTRSRLLLRLSVTISCSLYLQRKP